MLGELALNPTKLPVITPWHSNIFGPTTPKRKEFDKMKAIVEFIEGRGDS
jgi:hypothetical protein